MKKVRKLVKLFREVDESEEINIAFSSVIKNKDQDLGDERNEVNMKLNIYFEDKGFVFTENASIDESGLNDSKPHLNKKETNIFTQNMKISFNQI